MSHPGGGKGGNPFDDLEEGGAKPGRRFEGVRKAAGDAWSKVPSVRGRSQSGTGEEDETASHASSSSRFSLGSAASLGSAFASGVEQLSAAGKRKYKELEAAAKTAGKKGSEARKAAWDLLPKEYKDVKAMAGRGAAAVGRGAAAAGQSFREKRAAAGAKAAGALAYVRDLTHTDEAAQRAVVMELKKWVIPNYKEKGTDDETMDFVQGDASLAKRAADSITITPDRHVVLPSNSANFPEGNLDITVYVEAVVQVVLKAHKADLAGDLERSKSREGISREHGVLTRGESAREAMERGALKARHATTAITEAVVQGLMVSSPEVREAMGNLAAAVIRQNVTGPTPGTRFGFGSERGYQI